MRSIIIYVSVTGNTELIARTIQKGIIEVTGQCDITTHKEAPWRHLWEYNLIGFGNPPMLEHQENPSLKKAINNMHFVGGKHAFVFATTGTKPDYIFPSMIPRLKRRGMIVLGMYSCFAPAYGGPWPYITGGHPDEIDLKEAKDFGKRMVDYSRRVSAGETRLIPPVPRIPKDALEAWRKAKAIIAIEKKKGNNIVGPLAFKYQVKYHPEKCTYPKCRLCMDNCPEDAIDLSMDPPVIGKGCICCTFCSKICPTGAMDGSAATKNRSAADYKERIASLIQDSIKLEKQGRFRRLIPIEKVGSEGNVNEIFTKTPQWIVGKGFNK